MAKQIPLDQLVDNPYQPRTTFDPAALQSLAEEIKAEGFWNTILQGRQSKNGKIELVFGHRRLRALRLLKVPTVAVEIVDLTDTQMALRSLEENLQREGLTDLEIADAVRRAVDLVKADLRATGKNDAHAIAEVAKRIGRSVSGFSELCQISSSMDGKNRPPIQAGYMTAKTALAAKKWGGEAYLGTLAKQGKQAAIDGTIPRPTHMTVAAMQAAVTEAPESIREKLKAAIINGDVVTADEAKRRGVRLAAERRKHEKLPPPDLTTVIVAWIHQFPEIDQRMLEVIPFMETVPDTIANPFYAVLEHHIEIAKQLLACKRPARPADRPMRKVNEKRSKVG